MITNEMVLNVVKADLKAGNVESVINVVTELLEAVERRGVMNDQLLKQCRFYNNYLSIVK